MLKRLSKEEKIEQRRREIQSFVDVSAAFQRVFAGKDGEVVLDFLKKQLKGFDKDPYQHAFNAGKTRIFNIITEMTDGKQYDKHIEFLKETADAEAEKK